LKDVILSVLSEASPALNQLQDDWCIIGASALVLSGIANQKTQDIDVLLSSRDALYLKEVWRDRRINNYQPLQGDLFRSTFSRFDFGAMDIEAMGDLEVNRNGTWMPVKINAFNTIAIEGLTIKIPTLEEQIRVFKMLGRDKDLNKVRLIERSGLINASR